MKLKKLFLTLLLTCCAFFAPQALAATYGDFTYTISYNEVTITGYSGTAVSVTIPSKIANKSVTKIGDSVFNGHSEISSLSLPSSLLSIGNNAFSGCTGIREINFPATLSTIGNSAFLGCTAVTSITLSSKVTSLGGSVFSGCTGLRSISFGASIKTIPSYMCSGCTGLLALSIPSGITSIGTSAFSACTGLSDVSIPGTVVTIGGKAFNGCSGLVNLSIAEGVQYIGDSWSSAESFSGCSKLESLVLPASIKCVYNGSFENCSSLTSLNISEGLGEICKRAFIGCSRLETVDIPASVKFETGEEYSIFEYCTKLVAVNVNSANPYYTSIDGILFNKGIGTVYFCPRGKSLENYTLPTTVTKIGTHAFSNCSKLASINIPSWVSIIESYAFENCSSLTSIVLPSGVTKLEFCSFYGCSKLAYVALPEMLTQIGDDCFYGCSLTKIDLPSTLTYIGDYAFRASGDYKMLSIKIPKSVTSIGSMAFYGSVSCVIFEGDAPSVGGYWAYDARAFYYEGSVGFGSTIGGIPTSEIPKTTQAVLSWDSKEVAYYQSGSAIVIAMTKEDKQWRIKQSNAAWLRVKNEEKTEVVEYGIGSKRLYISVDTNQWNVPLQSRTGTIEFVCGDETKTITVTQTGSTPSLFVPYSSISSPGKASTFDGYVLTNFSNWTAQSNAAWLKISPATGVGGALSTAYKITVDENPSFSAARTGTITISAGTLTKTIFVTQATADYSLSVSSQALKFANIAETQNVSVSANAAWTISGKPTWLTLSQTSGSAGTTSLRVTASANASAISRSAKLVVTCGNLTKEIVVTQAGTGVTTVTPPNVPPEVPGWGRGSAGSLIPFSEIGILRLDALGTPVSESISTLGLNVSALPFCLDPDWLWCDIAGGELWAEALPNTSGARRESFILIPKLTGEIWMIFVIQEG